MLSSALQKGERQGPNYHCSHLWLAVIISLSGEFFPSLRVVIMTLEYSPSKLKAKL